MAPRRPHVRAAELISAVNRVTSPCAQTCAILVDPEIESEEGGTRICHASNAPCETARNDAANPRPVIVSIGAVAEDSSGYPDCRPEFFEAFQKTIDAGTKPETRIEIRTPIIHLSKAEIVQKGIELNAPLHLTWSCYRSEDLACGTCDSCALRLRGFERAGVADPIEYQK